MEISISTVLWKLGKKQLVAGITRTVWQNQEGNFHFQTSITPLFKTNLPLGALERAPGTSEAVSGGQGREDQYSPGMPWQGLGRAVAWLQRLASQSQAVMMAVPPSLRLLPLPTPRDTGYDQHGKSLISYQYLSLAWNSGENPKTSP